MTYRVWRKHSDNNVIGFCDADYTGFEPGGDLKTYGITIEDTPPVMPAPPPDFKQTKLQVVLDSSKIPQELKDYLVLR